MLQYDDAVSLRSVLREVETTAMTLSYKMVLLEAFQELDGCRKPPALAELAQRSWQVLQRRRPFLADLPPKMSDTTDGASDAWLRYWRENPINAWVGGNARVSPTAYFKTDNQWFESTLRVSETDRNALTTLVQELIDYRLASYEGRRAAATGGSNVIPFPQRKVSRTELPYFPDLKIACGHFRTASSEATEHRSLGEGYGRIDPARHFIARATGNSMDGGKNPIRDGDFLLVELVSPSNAGSITGSVMAIERQDESGDNQYLLRAVTKTADGSYVLKANNPAYHDIVATDGMRTLARLKAVIDPLELVVGNSFMREDIPTLFGEQFNPGKWNLGHISLDAQKAQVLLVTLNKQGHADQHHYFDHWIDEKTFHWQSQNSTTPESQRGQRIIEHAKLGLTIHLFVRAQKLQGGKAAPFVYHGKVQYRSHTHSAPMSVVFELAE